MTSEFFLLYSGTVAVLILVFLLCDYGLDWIVGRWTRRSSQFVNLEARRRTELRRATGGR